MENIIYTEELTSEAYLPFGNVVAGYPVDRSTVPRADKSIVFANMGTALRFNRLLDYKNLRSQAKMNVCVFRSTPIKMPFEIKLLERHQFSTQVFIPMSVKEKYLVIVAQGGDKPDLSTLRCFVANRTQGISYYPGIWHHPLCVLDEQADFTCLVSEDGTKDDTHVVDLEKTIVCKFNNKSRL